MFMYNRGIDDSSWGLTKPQLPSDNVQLDPLSLIDNNSSAFSIANTSTDPNLRREMLYNNALIREQREYNERMSGMQYQLAVQDMKKAGLNPYLFYANGGSGNTILGSNITPSSYASTAYTADTSDKMNKRDNTTRLLTSLLNSVSSAFNIGLQAKLSPNKK